VDHTAVYRSFRLMLLGGQTELSSSVHTGGQLTTRGGLTDVYLGQGGGSISTGLWMSVGNTLEFMRSCQRDARAAERFSAKFEC